MNGKDYKCPGKIPLDLVDDKWKFYILWALTSNSLRITQLAKLVPSISQRALSRKIKVLEEAQLVNRTIFLEIPPRIEYSLSEHGQRLIKVFAAMNIWGLQYAKDMGAEIEE